MIRKIKWNYNIGDIIKKDNLDIVIIDRRFNNHKQEYKIKCNKCGFNSGKHISVIKNPDRKEKDEYWIDYSNLNKLKSCPCCGNRTKLVVPGINDIPTTNPWMISYFQGGKDEAKLYTYNSREKIYPICPDCGDIKNKQVYIYQIYNNKTISCHCKDGISFPNKFAYYAFQQIIDKLSCYKREYQPEWAKPYYYDNYFKINNNEYIVEMDGGFHNKNNNMNGQTLEEIKMRDEIKNKLAISHNIKIIRIDCDTNDIDKIKNNFINGLNDIVDLYEINWSTVIEKSSSNLIKEICTFYTKNSHNLKNMSNLFNLDKSTIIKYLRIGNKCGWCNYIDKYNLKKIRYKTATELKNKHPEMATKEMANIINVDPNTVRKYLIKGTEEGLCEYNPEHEKIKNNKKNGVREKNKRTKVIIVYTLNGKYVGTFYGAKETIEYIKDNYNILLDSSNIYRVCTGKRKQSKGFIFKYKN